MLNDLLKKSATYNKIKNDKWLSDSYELLKNEFGKKIIYCGVEYIVVGLSVKSDCKENQKEYYSYTVSSEMYIVLKSSFINTIEISAKEYWKRYETKR